MDPSTALWIELGKWCAGFVVALIVILRVMAFLEKWSAGRMEAEKIAAKTRDDAYQKRDTDTQETLRKIDETNRRSLDLQEKAAGVYDQASRAYVDTSRVVAEELRLTRQALDTLTSEVRGIPAKTATSISMQLAQLSERISCIEKSLSKV